VYTQRVILLHVSGNAVILLLPSSYTSITSNAYVGLTSFLSLVHTGDYSRRKRRL